MQEMVSPSAARFLALSVGRLVVILLVAALAYAFGRHTATRQFAQMTTLHVTPDELAQAMQEDRFFADYGGYRLLVHGTVTAVHEGRAGGAVELGTTGPTTVLCELDSQPPSMHPGETTTVSTLALAAQRGTHAVELQHCAITP